MSKPIEVRDRKLVNLPKKPKLSKPAQEILLQIGLGHDTAWYDANTKELRAELTPHLTFHPFGLITLKKEGA